MNFSTNVSSGTPYCRPIDTAIEKASITPASVFEDGNKVFIRMSDHVDRSQLPVFMTVDHSGQTEVVNYRYFKPYLRGSVGPNRATTFAPTADPR